MEQSPTTPSQPVVPTQTQVQTEIVAPPVVQQPIVEQPITLVEKPKGAWTLVTAWIAFVVADLFFLALGPGCIVVAAAFSPFAWLASYVWIPSTYMTLTFVAPIIIILAGISIFFTYKKFPTKMRTVLILLSSIVVGLPITWLSLNGAIPMKIVIYAIIIGIIAVIPIILLIVFKVQDKKKMITLASPKPMDEKAMKNVFTVLLVTVVVEFGFAVFQLITSVLNSIP